jgi:hypothetical protein
LQQGGQNRPHRLFTDLNDTIINERTRGRGLERPGDSVASSFFKGDFGQIFRGGGGRIEVAICDRAGEVDRTPVADLKDTAFNERTRDAGAGAETAGGWCGIFVFRKGFWSIFSVGG